MAEKRRHDRINNDGKLLGKVILASEMEIIDISRGGIRFKCTKRISTNSKCHINLKCGDKTIPMTGNVVRSAFRGTTEVGAENFPVYEVAMEFDNMSDEKKEFLKNIIDSLGK
ncbi:MAG TPA: PilZ domain-containing protein [Nitrospirae bacterium]|nr:PilZ domain protein [bacterium BMS3Abin07]HDH01128.1 PilZ domain-containing protein [Nitrospirota bacterium]HDL20336.1 PilZ domain-containing protein [Nitrospirota bacterium]HDO22675.1 PilZ domain-containing protein [Nitrospirota bacterium]HDZ89041.1 PilZ domain-containing protein [Nitrospirota bacterium]